MALTMLANFILPPLADVSGKSQCHVSKSHLFADVIVTFSCHIIKKSTKGGKTKFVNIAKRYSQKKEEKNTVGGKVKGAYITGGKCQFSYNFFIINLL
jgi:hypothetical protein